MTVKIYLGDGVYAENEDDYQIKIYASDGINQDVVIYLDRSVFIQLLIYAKSVMKWENEK